MKEGIGRQSISVVDQFTVMDESEIAAGTNETDQAACTPWLDVVKGTAALLLTVGLASGLYRCLDFMLSISCLEMARAFPVLGQ